MERKNGMENEAKLLFIILIFFSVD